jgi:hypothetical protein
MSPHGLRKVCGERLAEAGCNAQEIMAMPSHCTLAEAQRHTIEANRQSIAATAMSKITKISGYKL